MARRSELLSDAQWRKIEPLLPKLPVGRLPPTLISNVTDAAAPTAEAAEQALEAFAARWDKRSPSISKSWPENWQRVIPFFAYPPEIRQVIYTTNAIGSINASLRKVTRRRGAFPNPGSARKVLYLARRSAGKAALA